MKKYVIELRDDKEVVVKTFIFDEEDDINALFKAQKMARESVNMKFDGGGMFVNEKITERELFFINDKNDMIQYTLRIIE